jgi:hypothetical protein
MITNIRSERFSNDLAYYDKSVFFFAELGLDEFKLCSPPFNLNVKTAASKT